MNVYLDYAATTPVDPFVANKMLHYFTYDGDFGNASSSHSFGKAAKLAIETARAQVAEILHADPSEIIWTSGATESINLALKGAAQLYSAKGKHIVTFKSEHKAVLDTCQQLEKNGFEVTYLAPQKNGLINLAEFQAALRSDTILVSVLHLNNETGVIQDVDAIAKITSERNILLHLDAVQSVGKISLDVHQIKVDLISFNAHKIYGPKGIGALYLRRKPRVRVAAQIHGGGQENAMRSGTLATHQIVGMGEALALAQHSYQQDYEKILQLRNYFCQHLKDVPFHVNGDYENSYPGILNLRFPGLRAEKILQAMPTVAVSLGSSCNAKGVEPSYVLRSMGLSFEEAHSSIRFSFGRYTTLEELDFVLARLQG